MLTSRRPFRGESQVETLNAILKEEPPPDPAVAALPPELERIRPPLPGEAAGAPLPLRGRPRARPAQFAHGYVLGDDSRPVPAEGRRSRLPRDRGRSRRARHRLRRIFLLGRRKTAFPSASGSPRTLAVLPFRAISAERMPEHFGLGLADSLIGRLAAVRELTVRPTSAIARYENGAGRGRDGRPRARRGRGPRGDLSEDRGHDPRNGPDDGRRPRAALIWSDRIELPEGRLFELQDEISSRIVDKLRAPARARRKSGRSRSRSRCRTA